MIRQRVADVNGCLFCMDLRRWYVFSEAERAALAASHTMSQISRSP